MKQFMLFVRKEFRHVLRDPKTLLVLFGMPVAQILIFGFALSGDIDNAPVMVFDQAHDALSGRLVEEIDASRYFSVGAPVTSVREIQRAFEEGKARVALVIPADFSDALHHGGTTQVQLVTDASDPNFATTQANYLAAIIGDFQAGIEEGGPTYRIVPRIQMLYNPQLKKEPNLVPGVIALILMLVCVMMTSVSIVREKETGTMEILLVSPVRPALMILSKAVPYLLLSLVNIATILGLSVWVLHVPVKGSLWLLFAESILFILTCLALGMLISVRVSSQQVALLISLVGMLLPTILFSGFLFPIANMPWILRLITNIVPSKWFYLIIKAVMIKGQGIGAVWKETLVLAGMTALFAGISIKNFKTRLS